MKKSSWLVIIAITLTLMLVGCESEYSAPPSSFQDADLVGTWEASYMEWGTDRLIIQADGTFRQVYQDWSVDGYVYETNWNEWWTERFLDGRIHVHLQGARYYLHGIRIAELDGMGDPCSEVFPDCPSENTPRLFYEPIAGEAIYMPGELVLNVQVDSSGNLVLLHMLLSQDDGFVSLTGKAQGFERIVDP